MKLNVTIARWMGLSALTLALQFPIRAQVAGAAPAPAAPAPAAPAPAPVAPPAGVAPTGDAPVETGPTLSPTNANDALIQYDPETDSIIVVADDATAASIQRIIDTMDQPIPQVLVKVLFLEVTHENDLDFGLDASYSFNTGVRPAIPPVSVAVPSALPGGSPTSFITEAAVPQFNESRTGSTAFGNAAQTQGGFFKLVDQNFTATLHALATANKLEVLSRPSILTRNNQDATITVGQSVPFITNTRFDTTGNQINTISYQDVGIILEVQPHITSGRMVEMYVAPEISTIDAKTVNISAGVNAITIDKRSATTNVVVPDGKTVVIGGMLQDNMISQYNRIPILGDIPWIGPILFGRTSTTKVKTELLIFLTPYVVDGPPRLAEVTLDEKNRTVLPERSFDQSEYDKFIDNIEGANGWKKTSE